MNEVNSWLETALKSAGFAVCLTLIAVGAGVGGVTTPAYAAEAEKPKQKTRRVPTISAPIFKKLEEAQALIDEKKYAEADALIQKLLDAGRGSKSKYNGNERAQLFNMLGFINFSRERYPAAISAYQSVLKEREDINEGLETTTLYTLAQLNFVAERYQKAQEFMLEWLELANNPGPDPYIFLGQVHYQLQDFNRAIPQIEKGISVAKQRGTAVKENWYALLNYLHYENENWPKVIEILEILVKQWPKRDYWYRLAGVYGQENQEDKQLQALEAAYQAGFLDRSKDLTTLAGLLLQAELPYRAAKVLDKGLKEGIVEKTAVNWRSLGQAWQLSQETDNAIDAMKKSGALDDNGRIYESLASLYLDKEQYGNCVNAADSALKKGGLRKTQSTHVIRGMCLYNDDKLNSGRASFVRARNASRKSKDKTTERMSAQWITFIDSESNRRTKLAEQQRAWEAEINGETLVEEGAEEAQGETPDEGAAQQSGG